MNIFISQDVIFFYLLLDKIIKSHSLSYLNKLKKFFELCSVSDVFTYSSLRNVLISTVNLYELRQFVLNKKNNNQTILKYLSKIHKIIELYLKEKIELSENNYVNELPIAIKALKENKNIEPASYLLNFAEYLKKKLNKKSKNIALEALYLSLKEYFDLFIDAKEIKLNEKYIQDKFKIYFDIFHLNPQIILFLNSENNIKIMQEFFPIEKYERISEILNIKTTVKLRDKYFLLEADKRLCSAKKPELLCHEIGHLLNLKVYNFQNIILNMLYTQNPQIDTTILNYWLNEIIADIIGYNICNSKNFIKNFSLIDNNISNIKYPPIEFRESILTDKEFDVNKINESEAKQVGILIQNNIKAIKDMLRIVK